MGLAASQARFLAITSRKASCEFQSMQIAQEKLSVTRDLQKATNDYQNKLNASILVWDESGTGQGDNPLQLTYDLMMTPSMANGYDPYLITNKQGKVVLNGRLADAAEAISDGRPVSRSEAGFRTFMNAIATAGYVAGSMLEKIAPSPYTDPKDPDKKITPPALYNKLAGMGGKLLDKSAAEAVTINGLTDILKDDKYKLNLFGTPSIDKKTQEITFADDGIFKLSIKDGKEPDEEMTVANSMKQGDGGYSGDKVVWLFEESTTAGSAITLVKNGGKALTKDEIANITLSDLLSDNYTLVMASADSGDMCGNNIKIPGIVSGADKSDGPDLIKTIAELLGMNNIGNGICMDDVANKALLFAYNRTKALYSGNVVDDGSPSSTSSSYKRVKNDASSYNGFIATKDKDLDRKENSHSAVSLSNILSTMLTYYALGLDGIDTGYSVDRKVSDSALVTDDYNYHYVVKNEEGVTEKELLMADFYSMLYNNICAYGWTENTNVDDPEYLSHALKNGQLFISSLANDGRYYQGPYSENGYVVEVKDDDAIARAELEFTNIKSRLTYKEEKLELDMKNLDLEISALTTEYDSVKNMLGKNVEKVFTMFSN